MELVEINIYPVKSTRRIALRESEVTPRGLPGDRRWMLVDARGKFITARQHPRLATVQARLEDGLPGRADMDRGARLRLEAPGQPVLELPRVAQDAVPLRVTVWRDQVQALPVSAAADAWFSDFLGIDCRLVYQPEVFERAVDPDFGRPGDRVSFADGFPLLLIGTASLDDLNARLQRPVEMRRFRPNLVVRTRVPYEEDAWRRLRLGELEFEGVKNCSRCIFTTVDPDTGERDPAGEPLRTLSNYRRREGGGVFFGQNLIPRSGGWLRLGDSLELLARH